MSGLWNWIDGKDLSRERKKRVFLLLNSTMFGVLGFIVWLIVSKFALDTWGYAFCFIGYPSFFIGYIGGFVYLCKK